MADQSSAPLSRMACRERRVNVQEPDARLFRKRLAVHIREGTPGRRVDLCGLSLLGVSRTLKSLSR